LSSASVREAREAGDRKSREQMAIARKRMKANQVRPITSKPAKELTAGR